MSGKRNNAIAGILRGMADKIETLDPASIVTCNHFSSTLKTGQDEGLTLRSADGRELLVLRICREGDPRDALEDIEYTAGNRRYPASLCVTEWKTEIVAS